MKRSRTLTLAVLIAAGMLSEGCAKKKVAAATPPAPPSVASPARTSPATVARQTPGSQTAAVATTATQRQPDAATRKRIDELLAKIEDAYFDYNKQSLRPDAIQALQKDSTELRDILRDYPHYNLTIEGYCDERGSAEYNVALGDARAKAAKDYLVGVGIPDGQLGVLSYGKEKQICDDHTETCWQKNRRIHIVAAAR
ncbi:MAG: OmpA family protein [Candidatus Solibacter sp.]